MHFKSPNNKTILIKKYHNLHKIFLFTHNSNTKKVIIIINREILTSGNTATSTQQKKSKITVWRKYKTPINPTIYTQKTELFCIIDVSLFHFCCHMKKFSWFLSRLGWENLFLLGDKEPLDFFERQNAGIPGIFIN